MMSCTPWGALLLIRCNMSNPPQRKAPRPERKKIIDTEVRRSPRIGQPHSRTKQTTTPTSSPTTYQPPTSLSLASEHEKEDSVTVDVVKTTELSSSEKTKSSKKTCPCQASDKTCWMIDCSFCNQLWHATCANLKSDMITDTVINSLTTWLCPWCYVPSFPRPNNHVSEKAEKSLLSAFISNDISNSVIFSLENKFDQLLETLPKHHIPAMVKTDELAKQVKSLEERISKYCDTSHPPDHSITDIDSSLTDTMKTIQTLTDRNTQLLERLESFQNEEHSRSRSKTDEHINRHDSPKHIHHGFPHVDKSKSAPPISHNFVAVDINRNNFISDKEQEDLLSFFQSVDSEFKVEGERGVLSYGEDYRYGKSSQHPTAGPEFPPLIENLVNRINTEHAGNYEVNQCLVNKYSGKNQLPEHSDNELLIDPESCIFTISVGASAIVTFRDKLTNDRSHIDCKARSLYAMSRKSQDLFTHKIEEHDLGEEVRYSLTFRRVHWQHKNSLCLIADSGSKYLKFGNGENTFGFTTPGTKIWAPKIRDIDPTSCCGYRNVMLLCGINSIRERNVAMPDIKELYYDFRFKVEQIRSLNPNCNIFVCPILPTKLTAYNLKANVFNELIFRDLVQSGCGVVPVLGFADLVDMRSGFLSDRYSFDGDALHLNQAGARILARLMKRSMFLNKISGGFHSSKSYAMASSKGASGGVT